ncbi:hypothetical protein B834_2687 [Enterococcus mundtii 1A]|nr:hypothetical protein [Enterococcus mundtii 1A]
MLYGIEGARKGKPIKALTKEGIEKVKAISITHKKTLSQIFFGNSKKV